MRAQTSYGQMVRYLPNPLLDDFVESYSDLHIAMRGQSFSTYDRIHICLDDDYAILSDQRLINSRCIAVFGNNRQHAALDTLGLKRYWCIELYRGTLPRLLRLDVDRAGPGYFEDWSKVPWLAALVHQVTTAQTPDERVAICDAILADAWADALTESPVEAGLFHIAWHEALLNVEEMAERVGVHRRSLERAFSARLGTSPLQEIRAGRFFRTLTEMRLQAKPSWRDLSYAPYADQSHFIRESHHFLGSAPSAFLRCTTQWTDLAYQPSHGAALKEDPTVADWRPTPWLPRYQARIEYLRRAAGAPNDAVIRLPEEALQPEPPG